MLLLTGPLFGGFILLKWKQDRNETGDLRSQREIKETAIYTDTWWTHGNGLARWTQLDVSNL